MIFRRFCSVSQYRYVLQGTLYCITTFSTEKKLCLAGLCHNFLSNFFWLAVPENFIGKPYSTFFRKTLAAKIFIDNRGVKGKEGVSRFSVKQF